NPARHLAGTEGPEQNPTNPGGRKQTDSRTPGQQGYPDYGYGKYSNNYGETAAENEEGIDGHLLHGDRSAPGHHHGFGFKALHIDIVPEEEGKKRKRRRR